MAQSEVRSKTSSTMEIMLRKVEKWIQEVNTAHESIRQSCSIFHDCFDGFYSQEFLGSSYFVVVDKLPKPDFSELREAGLGNFLDKDIAGITYKNTYYIHRSAVGELRLHFHELVHVIQWKELGALAFLKRYIQEIQTFGYERAPLEKMAYQLDAHYEVGGQAFNITEYVRKQLNSSTVPSQ